MRHYVLCILSTQPVKAGLAIKTRYAINSRNIAHIKRTSSGNFYFVTDTDFETTFLNLSHAPAEVERNNFFPCPILTSHPC
ncbi:hypothetical protein PUN28_009547 [Cardiocondyla obscurior]|uniref:Uncharacterized protein n=1 Tax=Cardiocondyla obscurior TaxID=286306 RepID=A0AAW2FUS4_9HYME